MEINILPALSFLTQTKTSNSVQQLKVTKGIQYEGSWCFAMAPSINVAGALFSPFIVLSEQGLSSDWLFGIFPAPPSQIKFLGMFNLWRKIDNIYNYMNFYVLKLVWLYVSFTVTFNFAS